MTLVHAFVDTFGLFLLYFGVWMGTILLFTFLIFGRFWRPK